MNRSAINILSRFQKHNSKSDQLFETGLNIVRRLLLFSIISLFFIVLPSEYGDILFSYIFFQIYFQSLGFLLFVSGAALTSGAVLGFLFGIPRKLQDDSKDAKYYDNTNLEQISDWLTKIIVGIGLVQAREIVGMLEIIAHYIAMGIGQTMWSTNGYAVAFSLIIVFTLVGFLYSYLWTRVRLLQVFSGMEGSLIQVQEKLEKIDKRTLERVRRKLNSYEATALPNPVLQALHPIEKYEDPQKNRFEGKSVSNNRRLTAKVEEIIHEMNYRLILQVEGINNVPLTGKVYFFLHDTFRNPVVETEPEDNKAIIQVTVYEAFTVGVVCDNGETLLELDLNDLKDVPNGFKY